MKRLEGKTALITGSDSGIGQAIAIAFAQEGADVVVTYHEDRKGAQQTLQEVEQAGRRGQVIQVDTGAEASVEQMFDEALEAFDTLDILVNNAATDAAGVPVSEMSTEQWDRSIKVNLYGYFYCARRFLKIRKEQGGGGKLINVTSVHEEVPMPNSADYNCAKGAIRNLTRSLALEVAEKGINVNNIAPGMILTPMNQKAKEDPKTREEKASNIPMKRAGQPEEVARLALFLASGDSDYVCGSTYVMDGGLLQHRGQGA